MTTADAIQVLRNYNAGIVLDDPSEQARMMQEAISVVIAAMSRCPVTDGKAIVMPKSIEGLFPHATCQTPDKCRREGVCFDGWNCDA